MPTRRGGSAPRRIGLVPAIGAAVAVTLGVGLIAMLAIQSRQAAVTTAKAWDIKGPPCPSLSAEEFAAKRYTAPKTFPYDGVTLGRLAGDASCSDVKTAGGKGFGTDKVCQFTSPAALTVATETARYYFVPGVGQPATVIVHDGVPRCVMASKFTLQTE
jgi:hypothetical protein